MKWRTRESSVGAGIDSFYEYLFKGAILFNDSELMEQFNEIYPIILDFIDESGRFFAFGNLDSNRLTSYLDSLSAFMPGLLAQYGDIERAERTFNGFYSLWIRYGILPERIDFKKVRVLHDGFFLRPELIESAYFLYRVRKYLN